VIGNPFAWATMAKVLVLRERWRLEEAEERFDAALRIATEVGDRRSPAGPAATRP
jgi:hypothetical protein